jgi:hypothetical protein
LTRTWDFREYVQAQNLLIALFVCHNHITPMSPGITPLTHMYATILSLIYTVLIANSQYGSINPLSDRTQIRYRAVKIHTLIILIIIHHPRTHTHPYQPRPNRSRALPFLPPWKSGNRKGKKSPSTNLLRTRRLVGFMVAHEKGQTLI